MLLTAEGLLPYAADETVSIKQARMVTGPDS